jgi:hypothetical protein
VPSPDHRCRRVPEIHVHHDGQTILRSSDAGQNLHRDLVLRVGATGIEPVTPRLQGESEGRLMPAQRTAWLHDLRERRSGRVWRCLHERAQWFPPMVPGRSGTPGGSPAAGMLEGNVIGQHPGPLPRSDQRARRESARTSQVGRVSPNMPGNVVSLVAPDDSEGHDPRQDRVVASPVDTKLGPRWARGSEPWPVMSARVWDGVGGAGGGKGRAGGSRVSG